MGLRFLLALFLCSSFIGSSQVDYPTQPSANYYEVLKSRVVPVIPTEQQLVSVKAETIPVGLKDTLLKYDWYEIASYYFFEKKYSSYFLDNLDKREKTQANNQFNFFRYKANGIRYDMSLQRYKDGTLKVQTTTFDENNAVKLLEVKKVATKNMLVTSIFGEKEMQEILSYKNGILIMNVKQAPNSTTKRFHMAYLAVPKTF
ncbi:MAG: hypothetical protein K0S32_1968 [Bacteroidetes bacterium]|jgi:hypothetical protein|nr:hypothetical protein [Bacteroidota bacterium]